MNDDDHPAPGPTGASRRRFLTGAAGAAAAAGAAVLGAHGNALAAAEALRARAAADGAADLRTASRSEPFWGAHQGGILTAPQRHTYFAAFDLSTGRRDELIGLLRAWTAAAARLSAGRPAQPLDAGLRPLEAAGAAGAEAERPAADSGETLGMGAARLTVTFGFGASLFDRDGKDRYALASQRPAALVDLPGFVGDELVAAQCGGDLSVQACADDPQVSFHAIRQLARIGAAVAAIRWVQAGFLPDFPRGQTPRNLMGFKDGTVNPSPRDPQLMEQFVWVGAEGLRWMRGGSYLVARRIRMALEHWDRVSVGFQEQTFGRGKYSGAPLGGSHELDAVDLQATDRDGSPLIPANAHVRLAAAATNGGAQILRRPYSYDNGYDFTAERWPPWRQGLEYDAGLLFLCYQRDPRSGFIRIFERLSRLDMLNQFVTHVGSGLFACPPGAAPGQFIGQELFERA